MTPRERKAIIVGAGPAGLTAACELLRTTNVQPVILEKSGEVGGIAKTIVHNGNRMDIGGHRFFSKSDTVMRWWLEMLPLQGKPSRDDIILKRRLPFSDDPSAPDPETTDKAMLLRNRHSRIYYLRRFFDYPVTLNMATVKNLGLTRMAGIGLSYLKTKLSPVKEERSLEDFMVNRFGRELYLTFFKDYTEKVWGVAPSDIKPDWGAQRIKGLSVRKVLLHAVKSLFDGKKDLAQKDTETSLIERFIYPKLGPGQLWNEAANYIVNNGGRILFHHEVTGIDCAGNRVDRLAFRNPVTGETGTLQGDYFISTMPVKDLIGGMGRAVPAGVREIAGGLVYRDFVSVGLLLKELKIRNETKEKTVNDIIKDLWIYIQERDVRAGRLQIYNNWSPYLVKDPATVWLGVEYFCNEGDDLWRLSDEALRDYAAAELAKIGIIDASGVLDFRVIRETKVYPAYFGTYDRFDTVRKFVDGFGNLFLVGRNGMHHYNNMDHSMLTAMAAVGNIARGITTKDNLWEINTEQEYHENRETPRSERR